MILCLGQSTIRTLGRESEKEWRRTNREILAMSKWPRAKLSFYSSNGLSNGQEVYKGSKSFCSGIKRYSLCTYMKEFKICKSKRVWHFLDEIENGMEMKEFFSLGAFPVRWRNSLEFLKLYPLWLLGQESRSTKSHCQAPLRECHTVIAGNGGTILFLFMLAGAPIGGQKCQALTGEINTRTILQLTHNLPLRLKFKFIHPICIQRSKTSLTASHQSELRFDDKIRSDGDQLSSCRCYHPTTSPAPFLSVLLYSCCNGYKAKDL